MAPDDGFNIGDIQPFVWQTLRRKPLAFDCLLACLARSLAFCSRSLCLYQNASLAPLAETFELSYNFFEKSAALLACTPPPSH